MGNPVTFKPAGVSLPDPKINTESKPTANPDVSGAVENKGAPAVTPRQAGLATAEAWQLYLKEQEKLVGDRQGGLLWKADALGATWISKKGEAPADKWKGFWRIENDLQKELKSRLESGKSATLREALGQVHAEGKAELKARAAFYLDEGGFFLGRRHRHSLPPVVDPDDGKFLDKHHALFRALLDFNAKLPASPKSSETLHDLAFGIEAKGAVQAPFAFYTLISMLGADPKYREKAAAGMKALTGKAGFLRSMKKFVYSRGAEGLAVDIGLFFVAGGVGHLAKLHSAAKLAKAGVALGRANLIGKGAGMFAEHQALFGLQTARSVLERDARKFMTKENLKNQYLASGAVLRGGHLMGAIGRSVGTKLAIAGGLTKIGTGELSKLGQAVVKTGAHAGGMGGMMAANKMSQAAGWAPKPVGGWKEGLVNDVLGYVEFAGAQKGLNAATGGRVLEIQKSWHGDAVAPQAVTATLSAPAGKSKSVRGSAPSEEAPRFEEAWRTHERDSGVLRHAMGLLAAKYIEMVFASKAQPGQVVHIRRGPKILDVNFSRPELETSFVKGAGNPREYQINIVVKNPRDRAAVLAGLPEVFRSVSQYKTGPKTGKKFIFEGDKNYPVKLVKKHGRSYLELTSPEGKKLAARLKVSVALSAEQREARIRAEEKRPALAEPLRLAARAEAPAIQRPRRGNPALGETGETFVEGKGTPKPAANPGGRLAANGLMAFGAVAGFEVPTAVIVGGVILAGLPFVPAAWRALRKMVSGKTAEKAPAAVFRTSPSPDVQKFNEKIISGDADAIRDGKVYYIQEFESIGGNAGRGHAAYNMYVDPANGRIVAVGNVQNIPASVRAGMAEMTLHVQVPNMAEVLQGNDRQIVRDVYFGTTPEVPAGIRSLLLDLKGKTFSWGRTSIPSASAPADRPAPARPRETVVAARAPAPVLQRPSTARLGGSDTPKVVVKSADGRLEMAFEKLATEGQVTISEHRGQLTARPLGDASPLFMILRTLDGYYVAPRPGIPDGARVVRNGQSRPFESGMALSPGAKIQLHIPGKSPLFLEFPPEPMTPTPR